MAPARLDIFVVMETTIGAEDKGPSKKNNCTLLAAMMEKSICYLTCYAYFFQ
ncbi:hypothetical protein HAT2_00466 [Candidatus Similichlamydia laticola]|uniref:Uncharacterized protein n=1 Tax=Candidatus Similichlamydia laticola TaxID=2170265 RepID=A0A369KA03_9BACT|nr:hypothetical protein HAT2_00466 [Candidatus Similichlamydia laticola]